MKKILLYATVLGASLATLPTAAIAQRAPAAAIVIVDTDRIGRECTACLAASATMRAQEAALRTRAQTLQTQLQTEGKPIETAINALGGKQPDAALQARIAAFQTKERNAQQELANAQRNLQSTQANVSQQLGARLGPIISSVAQTRGANIALDKGTTLYAAATVDVTADVLAQLNAQLPSVRVVPLPEKPASPQGR
jgi:Skp family chaperone for outer membrane proteins